MYDLKINSTVGSELALHIGKLGLSPSTSYGPIGRNAKAKNCSHNLLRIQCLYIPTVD